MRGYELRWVLDDEHCPEDEQHLRDEISVPIKPDLRIEIRALATVAWTFGAYGHPIAKAHETAEKALDKLGIEDNNA